MCIHLHANFFLIFFICEIHRNKQVLTPLPLNSKEMVPNYTNINIAEKADSPLEFSCFWEMDTN